MPDRPAGWWRAWRDRFGLAEVCGTLAAAAARRATIHLGGWRRLAAGAWHAVREQLASCAVAETVDGFLIRPGCMVGAAWLLRALPGGVWIGFVAGKGAADVAWYGLEAFARRGVRLVRQGVTARPVRDHGQVPA